MRPLLRRSGQLVSFSQRGINASLRHSQNNRILAARIGPTASPFATRPYSKKSNDPAKDSDDNASKSSADAAAQKKDQSDSIKASDATGRSQKDDSVKSASTPQDAQQEPVKSSATSEETQQGTVKASETGSEAKNTKASGDAKSALLPGNLPLSESEKEMIRDVVHEARSMLSERDIQHLDKIVQRLEQTGISPEFRDLLQHYKDGKLDILSTFKLMKHSMNIVRDATRHIVDEEMAERRNGRPQNSTDQSSSQSSSNQNRQQKQGANQKGPDPFNMRGIKLDTNTLIMSAFLTYLTWGLLVPGENEKEITWQEFRATFLEKGLVEKVLVLNRSRAKVFLHRDAVASMYPESPAVHANFHYYFTLGSVESFERNLEDAQNAMGIPSSERIPVAYQESGPWLPTILSLTPTLLLLGGLAFMSRRAGGGGQSGIFGMGRSRAKKFNHETEVKVKFSDVAGMDEAKQEIMEFVSFLKEPGIYQKLGAKIPRGAILSGPPGTGKTLIAKATAGESGVPFFSVSGSEFVEMFVGVGPSRVRDLFATARKNTPCIIFIDEIDAIGKARSSKGFGGGNDERESTLNQILTEMDGFNTTEQVVVMAGTNRIDILDQALLRPGRFDRHIVIDKPTMDGRKQIFAVHLKKVVTKEDIEHLKGRLAALTPGFSGADIANAVNEAALVAARQKATSVEMAHFEQAIERVIGGLERKSLVLSPQEKRTVAYHEAGHAICGWFFKHADPLLKVSIIPRGQGALGYAQYLPNNGDTYLMNANQLMDRMAMTLGGRVSEELHFESVTSGASDDFKKVTQMATAMVTRFGMSRKIGYLSFAEDQQQFHKPFSEETAKNIDAEVRRIVEEAYTQCRNLLVEKKKEVGILAEELLRKEMLTRDDVVRLLGPRPFEEKGEFHKYFDGRVGGPAPTEGIPGPPGTTDPPLDSAPPPGGPTPTPAFKKDVF